MEETIVLYPATGMSHLISIVELAKVFLRRGFAVYVITIESTYTTDVAAAIAMFIESMSSAYPSIAFHRLPAASLPPNHSPHQEVNAVDLLRLSNPHLLSAVSSLSKSTSIRALIVDFLCTMAMDVAKKLGIPSYVYYPCSASTLAVALHLPSMHSKVTASFKDLGDHPLHFPGIPPIPAYDMPLQVLDRDEDTYKLFIIQFDRMPDADGIITNSFLSLERRALQAIADGLAVPDRKVPPVYCVGPLTTRQTESHHECLQWLEGQPRRSVVFLCFGSLGIFPLKQLREIAIGLERSGQRFLWVVRIPPAIPTTGAAGGVESVKLTEAPPESELEALLPDGFLDRTANRGMVVKSWAPQAEVLRHAAVGGFVSHVGWNSVLEAVVGGVPMVAWPLYSEQRMNKVTLVAAGLAAEMKGYESGLVMAEEVEKKVRGLVEADWGRELKERMEEVRLTAEAALAEGGSSSAAVNELVAKWKTGIQ